MILCLFSRIKIVDSFIESTSYIVEGSFLFFSFSFFLSLFFPLFLLSNLISFYGPGLKSHLKSDCLFLFPWRLLNYCATILQWAYVFRLVIIVAHRVHGWKYWWLFSFLLGSIPLTIRHESSRWVLALFFCVQWLKYAVITS